MQRNHVIQFNLKHTTEPAKIDFSAIAEIEKYRLMLLKKGLIGKLTEHEPVKEFRGCDCGNMSVRIPCGMLITGTQTSSKSILMENDFSIVYDYNADAFTVYSTGMTPPSSETPLHWCSYEADSRIRSVIHAHIFNYSPERNWVDAFCASHDVPLLKSKSKSTQYIGKELIPLIQERGYKDVIGMPVHDGGFGLVSFGADTREAYERLMEFVERLKIHEK